MKPVCIYALIDKRPGSKTLSQPFYVGIGSRRRPGSHASQARRGVHKNEMVQTVFDRHLRDGVSPEARILAIVPSGDYAWEMEQRLIASYGRRRVPVERGVLCNIARGGDGPDPFIMNDPRIVAKIAESTRTRFSDPAQRAAMSGRMREVFASEALRTAVGAGTKKALQREDVRTRHLAGLKRVNESLTSEQRRQWMVAAWARDPERRVRTSETQKMLKADPEVRKRLSAIAREANLRSWSDPEIRARRIAGMKGKKKTRSPKQLGG